MPEEEKTSGNNSKKKVISISPKMFIATLAPLLIIALFAIFSFLNVTTSFTNGNLTSSGFLMMDKVEREVMNHLMPELVSIETISNLAVQTQDKEEIEQTLRSCSASYPDISAFYFVTAEPCNSKNGFLAMSYDWKAPSKDWNQLSRPWFIAGVEGKGKTVLTEPYTNARDGKMCVSIVKAVYNSRNVMIGVAGCDFTLENFTQTINNFAITQNSNLHILNREGLYITNSKSDAIMKDNYFDSPAMKYANITAKTHLNGEAKSFSKGKYFYAVKQVGDYGWFVVADSPTADFLGVFRFKIFLVIILTGVVCAICSVIILIMVNKMGEGEKLIAEKLFSETQNLVVASRETAATSQDQSAAVKEIVATMEDSNTLSENISTKIKDVTSIANKTSTDVLSGVETLSQNVQKLHEIFDANQQTIAGIKSLGDKIENIWDIVTLINSVADQAKIIAFNAELEASSAGEAGKNFHIVASEIRRLADGIIDGTKEIKERINEIQQSSDSLILMSESGTEKINEGCEKAKELEEKFNSIKSSAEVTATSSGDITNIIQQQAVASEQILITLKQIAAGVENFTQATENISSSSSKLRGIAEKLNGQKNKA